MLRWGPVDDSTSPPDLNKKRTRADDNSKKKRAHLTSNERKGEKNRRHPFPGVLGKKKEPSLPPSEAAVLFKKVARVATLETRTKFCVCWRASTLRTPKT